MAGEREGNEWGIKDEGQRRKAKEKGREKGGEGREDFAPRGKQKRRRHKLNVLKCINTVHDRPGGSR